MTKACIVCAQKRNVSLAPTVTPLKVIPVNPQVFWRIHVDLFGPLPLSSSGNKYGVIAMDAFSKYVEARRNKHFTPSIQ